MSCEHKRIRYMDDTTRPEISTWGHVIRSGPNPRCLDCGEQMPWPVHESTEAWLKAQLDLAAIKNPIVEDLPWKDGGKK